MEPVPYEVRDEDIEEVLAAYDVPEDVRSVAREHVMRQVTEIDEIVRTAPEVPLERLLVDRYEGGEADRPGDMSAARQELALAAIEDILIRDGFIEIFPNEKRIYPAVPGRSD